jgi:hypothetical protein
MQLKAPSVFWRHSRSTIDADPMHDRPAIHCLVLAMLMMVVQPLWAASDCDAPPESWQPRSAVRALAQRNGWQVDRLKVDDGCYEIKGRDAEGQRFKAKIDPATLNVLSVKLEHGDRERERQREGQRAPAPPAASAGANTPAR